MPTYEELLKRDEYKPVDVIGLIVAGIEKLKTLFEQKPVAAENIQKQRAERAQRPASNPTVEEVKTSFEESAAADADAIDGLSGRRRGEKRKAEEAPEEHFETTEDIAKRVMEKTDPYEILGLPADAKRREVDTRFKRLTLLFHPDKNKDPQAPNVFVKIKSARDELLQKLKPEETSSAAVKFDETDPKRQSGETDDEAYLVRLFRAQKVYEGFIRESDDAVRDANKDIQQLDNDIAGLPANDLPETNAARQSLLEARAGLTKVVSELLDERSKMAGKLEAIQNASQAVINVLRQRDNARRLSEGKASVSEEHWVRKFKSERNLNFGKTRSKHLTLYNFMGRYRKRCPHVHPSKVIRKFMRAMIMLL